MPPAQIGRYRVEEQLGEGGMGMVFAAHDPELGRRVAVKLLRPDRLGSNPARAGEKLREEAQAMARLSHPNVATVFDVGEHEGGVYIAMELVDGQSLREWLKKTIRPWREVLSMYFQAGLGLAAAHDVGMVHRDFKPANVLVGRDGRARVVDFGLASSGAPILPPPDGDTSDVEATSGSNPYHRPTFLGDLDDTVDEQGKHSRSPLSRITGLETTGVIQTQQSDPSRSPSDVLTTQGSPERTIDGTAGLTTMGLTTMGPDPGATLPAELTHAGVVVGTPAYMAPELFLGHAADARTDQFAFSVSLFEGLYGYRPFVGATASAIAEEVLAGRVAPRPEGTRVPRWVHASVVQGLAVRRRDRHPSVRSLLASIAFLARVVWD
ncbi:MAG: serine/threonine-protein kinase [Myxococcota bacterium]